MPEQELSEKTHIRIPIALAITICIGLITFGGTYFKLVNTIDKVETLEKLVRQNEELDREARHELKDEVEKDIDNLSANFMDWLEKEVGGLRSDWERDRQEQNRRLNNLE